jgi:Flp pilus assembly protein protease CpaA
VKISRHEVLKNLLNSGKRVTNFLVPMIILINIFVITLFLIISLYLDIKFRMLPHYLLKIFLIVCISLNVVEFIFLHNLSFRYIVQKVFFLSIVFIICLILFILKIIGGGDGKLLIIIFSIHPLCLLSFLVLISFFLLFSLLFFSFFLINYFFNNFNKNSSYFDIHFYCNRELLNFKKIYVRMFFNFVNISKINRIVASKLEFKGKNIFYNDKKRAFIVLVQIRAPLVLLCIIAYYIDLLIFLGI